MIFKGVRDGKPYPDHGLSLRDWSRIPPRQVRLDEIVTTTKVLELDRLLSEDSTFYGDLFPHAVQWQGVLYLEDGLHRAVRSALRNRPVLHARVFDYDALAPSPDALLDSPVLDAPLLDSPAPDAPASEPPPATGPFPGDTSTGGRHRSDDTGPV